MLGWLQTHPADSGTGLGCWELSLWRCSTSSSQAEAVSREDQRDNGTWHWDWCPSKGRREGALAGSWCLASLVMDPSKAWRGPEHSPSCSHSLGGKASPCSSFPGLPIPPWLWLLQGGSSELPLGWEDVPPSQWDVQVSVCHSC